MADTERAVGLLRCTFRPVFHHLESALLYYVAVVLPAGPCPAI